LIFRTKNLEEHVLSLQNDYTNAKTELSETHKKLCQTKIEAKTLKNEMNVVNQFMSKMLLGVGHNNIDIDTLIQVLEQNRSLLIEMTKSNMDIEEDGAFLPKILYDIISQVDNRANDTEESNDMVPSSEEIANKLPKVWKVLIELLNLENEYETPLEVTDFKLKISKLF
jgi:hypothetical protein